MSAISAVCWRMENLLWVMAASRCIWNIDTPETAGYGKYPRDAYMIGNGHLLLEHLPI